MIDKITREHITLIKKGFDEKYHDSLIMTFIIEKVNELVDVVNKSVADQSSASQSPSKGE